MIRLHKSAWPHLLLFRSGGLWMCEAKYCNVVGHGETMREAYDDWYHWYNLPY